MCMLTLWVGAWARNGDCRSARGCSRSGSVGEDIGTDARGGMSQGGKEGIYRECHGEWGRGNGTGGIAYGQGREWVRGEMRKGWGEEWEKQ